MKFSCLASVFYNYINIYYERGGGDGMSAFDKMALLPVRPASRHHGSFNPNEPRSRTRPRPMTECMMLSARCCPIDAERCFCFSLDRPNRGHPSLYRECAVHIEIRDLVHQTSDLYRSMIRSWTLVMRRKASLMDLFSRLLSLFGLIKLSGAPPTLNWENW